MKKIPTVLVRDPDDRAHVLPEVAPGCEWVFAGEGVPTRKYDGTCVMLDDEERWWARREVKPGKTSPHGFLLEDHDETTGKSQGWEPIEQSPFVKPWREASAFRDCKPGTYELCGPKINGNPEGMDNHRLVRHGAFIMEDNPGPRSTDEIMELVKAKPYEGVVWHHPDGRMAKLKRRDIP